MRVTFSIPKLYLRAVYFKYLNKLKYALNSQKNKCKILSEKIQGFIKSQPGIFEEEFEGFGKQKKRKNYDNEYEY